MMKPRQRPPVPTNYVRTRIEVWTTKSRNVLLDPGEGDKATSLGLILLIILVIFLLGGFSGRFGGYGYGHGGIGIIGIILIIIVVLMLGRL